MHLLAATLLLLCDIGDEQYLGDRLEALARAYESAERRQSPEAIKLRVGVMREVAHLPWEGDARVAAAALLARVVANDRAYRVRAEACRAIGRVGTSRAIKAMYRALFSKSGRSPRYALLYTVLPDALASLRSRDDWEWIRARVIDPSRAAKAKGLVHTAAHRARAMLILTLDGAGRAGRRELVESVRPFATHAHAEVRAAALRALGRMRASPDLVQAGLRDEDEVVRMAAARASSLPSIQIDRALLDASVAVRRMALRNLAERDYRVAVPRLIAQLRVDGSSYARLDIALLLGAATGQDFGEDATLWRGWWRAQVARRPRPARPVTDERRTGTGRNFRAHRVLFLVDASASMNQVGADGKSRQQKQIETMREFIRAASRGTRYAVIAFASELRRLPSRTIDVAAGKVLPWVDSLKPAGASNSYAALMQGLQDPFRPDTIVVLSDGIPLHCSWHGRNYSEPEQILAEVRRANRRSLVRIHTVGMLGGIPRGDELLDQESAIAFLRRLAAENEGTYREVR